MGKKESNLLPFLLGAGAVAAAGIAYKKYKESKEETTDDNTWLAGGYGTGGAADFYGNSSVINPEYAPDSVANGIEDIARGEAIDGLTDPSSGGVNPNKYGTDGLDLFSLGYDVVTDPLVITGAAGFALDKAGKTVSKKLPQTGKTMTKVGKGLGRLGIIGMGIQGVNWLMDTTGTKEDIKNVVNEIVGRDSIVTDLYDYSFPSAADKAITTDQAVSEAHGNVVYDNGTAKSNTVSTGTVYVKTADNSNRYTKTTPIQYQTALGLAGTGSQNVGVTAAETAVVNDALGTSGAVVKQTYGKSGVSYIGDNGKQLTYAGTDLQTAANAYKAHNAGNQSQSQTAPTPSYRH